MFSRVATLHRAVARYFRFRNVCDIPRQLLTWLCRRGQPEHPINPIYSVHRLATDSTSSVLPLLRSELATRLVLRFKLVEFLFVVGRPVVNNIEPKLRLTIGEERDSEERARKVRSLCSQGISPRLPFHAPVNQLPFDRSPLFPPILLGLSSVCPPCFQRRGYERLRSFLINLTPCILSEILGDWRSFARIGRVWPLREAGLKLTQISSSIISRHDSKEKTSFSLKLLRVNTRDAETRRGRFVTKQRGIGTNSDRHADRPLRNAISAENGRAGRWMNPRPAFGLVEDNASRSLLFVGQHRRHRWQEE